MNCHPHLIRLATLAAGFTICNGEPVPRMLPGELSAEEILNGAYPFPASPEFPVTYDASGFAIERVSKVPAPGVHPAFSSVRRIFQICAGV